MEHAAQPTRNSLQAELVTTFAIDGDFVTGEELLNRGYTKIPCLLDPLLPSVGIAGLVGGSDTGKSTFLRQFAVSIVIGQGYFLGYSINAPHKSTIYASTEDDEASIAYLLSTMPQVNTNYPAAFKKLRFIFESDGLLAKLDRILTNAPADYSLFFCSNVFIPLPGIIAG